MSNRVDRLRAALDTADLDALLVSNDYNRRYLSGFTGTSGWLLVSQDAATLATDFRYWEQVAGQAPAFTLYKQEGPLATWLPGFLATLGGKKIGFESTDVSVASHKQLRDVIAGMAAPQRPSLLQVEGVVERLRSVKDADEIDALERAVRVGDEAFVHVADQIEPGWPETRVAWEIEKYARQHGAEAMSFPTIVGGGPWGAMPHCYPRANPIAAGQPVVIDMGVVVEGYCSDMTRTIVVGTPDDRFQQLYDIVLGAQETAEETIEAGMSGAAAHQIAHDLIERAGYGDNFGHGLGHGVGLEIHEHPRVGKSSDDTIEDGMVITVEPGIYIPGWGGIRIEDMGVMEDGKYRNVTTAPKLRMIEA